MRNNGNTMGNLRAEIFITTKSNTYLPGLELKGANWVLVTLGLEFLKNWSL